MSFIDVQLGELADVIRGITFPTAAKRKEPAQGLVACLRTTNVQETVAWDDLLYVPEVYVRNEEQYVKDGDILVSMSNSLELVGKCALVTGSEKTAVFGAFIAVVRVHEGVQPSYLFHAMRSPAFRAYVRDVASTTTNISNINSSKLLAAPVRLYDKQRSKAIASKIDELFSRIDEGERALKQVSKLVERYRHSVLKAAVTGVLTRDWRDARKTAGEPIETGDVLLTRILTARREAWEQAELAKMKAKGVKPANDKWRQKYREPMPPDTSDLPELPNGWLWVSMDMLTRDFITGPYGSALHKSDYITDGVPLVNPINLRGGVITPDATVTVTSETRDRLVRYKLELGDIVLARRGEMGRCALVSDKEVGWMCGTGSAILRCTDAVLPGFVAMALASAHSRKFLEDNCAGTTMHNLNQDAMARVPIPIAGLTEQAIALDHLHAQLTLALVVDRERGNEARRSHALRQSLLKSAFRGELVDQDPADVPASILLERIAAERATRTVAAPKRRRKKMSA